MSGKETKSLRKRRRMEFPDTYIILIGLCLLAVILTIVLPAGQYDREGMADSSSGRYLS